MNNADKLEKACHILSFKNLVTHVNNNFYIQEDCDDDITLENEILTRLMPNIAKATAPNDRTPAKFTTFETSPFWTAMDLRSMRRKLKKRADGMKKNAHLAAAAKISQSRERTPIQMLRGSTACRKRSRSRGRKAMNIHQHEYAWRSALLLETLILNQSWAEWKNRHWRPSGYELPYRHKLNYALKWSQEKSFWFADFENSWPQQYRHCLCRPDKSDWQTKCSMIHGFLKATFMSKSNI